MGERIRAFDWDMTPLGPPEQWPQALKTLVNLLLASKQPMFLGWGPERTWLYNDAFIPILGRKHPSALGHPSMKVWAEARDVLEPMFDRVFAGEPVAIEDFSLGLDRQGKVEEAHFEFAYTPVRGEDGSVQGLFGACIETTARVRAERGLAAQAEATEAANQRLSALVSATADIIYEMSADWREMRTLQGRGFLSDTETPSVAWLEDYIFPEDQTHILKAIESAIKHKQPFQLEHRVRRADGSVGWTFSRAVPLLNDAGDITGWFGAASDVTARKEAEEHLRLVINELNHRVKNTLAMVQAVAAQTFRGEDDPLTEKEKFTARVKALAHATDLMTGQKWVETSLRTIIDSVVGVYCNEIPERCDYTGPDIKLEPKTAISLSMAFHELATNATKYGAWSDAAGKVSIRCVVEGSGSDARLRLEWQKSGGPAVSPPRRRGFGSRLIERGLAAEMDGAALMRFEPTGLVCVIDAPFANEELS